jgi:hypothetical protein
MIRVSGAVMWRGKGGQRGDFLVDLIFFPVVEHHVTGIQSSHAMGDEMDSRGSGFVQNADDGLFELLGTSIHASGPGEVGAISGKSFADQGCSDTLEVMETVEERRSRSVNAEQGIPKDIEPGESMNEKNRSGHGFKGTDRFLLSSV